MTFSGHSRGSASYRRLIGGLFFAGIATFAQLYSPQSVLPLISDDLRVSPATAALTVSAATLGLAVAVIPWSSVADRLGRVRAMAIGVVAATCFGLAAPFSADVGTLLALRLLEGAALGAVPSVALVYLSEEVERRSVAAAAGSYIAGTTVGGLLGRVLSGLVAELGDWRLGLGSTAMVCALSAVVFLWLVPRPRRFADARADAEARSLLQRVFACIGSAPQLALYAQGLLLMGAFVAVYNYLGFHLTAEPFLLPAWLVTLLFLAYLAGTASSPLAGALASARGRFPVLLGSMAVMSLGALLMLVPQTLVVLIGLLLFTAGFFGAHAVASGWTPVAAPPGTGSQASSLYYFSYYAGSSLFGWGLGIVFGVADWSWFVAGVVAMCVLSAAVAVIGLRSESTGRV